MKRPVSSFVLALISLVLSPIVIFIQFTALFGAAMITYEPNNSPIVKALAVAVVILIGLLALAVPVLALVLGTKARTAAQSIPTEGTGLATAAIVIAGIVTAGIVVVQVYFILMVVGA